MEVFRKTVEILIDQTEKSIITDEAFPHLLQTQVASSVHLYFKQSVCVKIVTHQHDIMLLAKAKGFQRMVAE